MATLNPAQVEFLRLMSEAGWSDAETARRLNVSRAAISQIRSGKNNPETTLERLRLAVADVSPQPVEEQAKPSKEEQNAVAELRWRLEFLARHDRKAYGTVSELINTFYERAKAVNSGPDAVASAALAGAVAELKGNRPVVFGRSHEAGEPSGKTSSPKRGDQKR